MADQLLEQARDILEGPIVRLVFGRFLDAMLTLEGLCRTEEGRAHLHLGSDTYWSECPEDIPLPCKLTDLYSSPHSLWVMCSKTSISPCGSACWERAFPS
jgi:hypothetical protein